MQILNAWRMHESQTMFKLMFPFFYFLHINTGQMPEMGVIVHIFYCLY